MACQLFVLSLMLWMKARLSLGVCVCVRVCVCFHTAVILGTSTQQSISRQPRLTPKRCAPLWISHAHINTLTHSHRCMHVCSCWAGISASKSVVLGNKSNRTHAACFNRCVSLYKYVGLKVDCLFAVRAWKSAKTSVICSAKTTKQSVWHTLGLNCSLHTKFLTVLPVP